MTANDPAYAHSPVDAYLDDLFDRLAGTGAPGRRALAEAEDHLRAATDDRVTLGLDRPAAEQAAVTAFGPAASLAAAIRAVHRPVAWLRPAIVAAWLAGGLGLLAVGASGLVAEILGRIFGAEFVAGDGPGVTYTADRCAEYLALSPGTRICGQAAALDHWGEVVQSRVAAGVLGLLVLGALWWARRNTPLGSGAWAPPPGGVALPMGALSAVAGLGLTGIALIQIAFGDTSMVGANLSAGVVALAAAVVAAVRLSRRSPSPGTGG
jgi:hypothetical protein